MIDTEQKRIKAICKVAHIDDISDLSDGYHTFKQLYYQRMMLFAALVKQNRDKAWKSLRHEEGELCFGGGWFIVGIDTPEGSYTYHYEDNYFSLFDCEELEKGKTWDGHTEKDVTRLLSLEQEPCGDAISKQAVDTLVDELARAISDERCCISRGRSTATIMRDIRDLPPVRPQEPKTDVLDGIRNVPDHDDGMVWEALSHAQRDVALLPPVTPQSNIGHCRECRWWKDSDGVFRRGSGAESQCPMNRKEVYEGNGYCYMFEPEESEG